MMLRTSIAPWLTALLTIVSANGAWAQDDSRSKVKVYVYPARVNVAPGDDLPVAIIMDHDPAWHTNTSAPKMPPGLEDLAGDLIPTTIGASSTGALVPHVDHIQWPAPHSVTLPWLDRKAQFEVYSGRVIAYLPVTVPANAPLGPATLTVTVGFQACDDASCLAPATLEFPVQVSIVPPERADSRDGLDPALFGGFSHGVWQALDRRSSADRGTADTGETATLVLLLVIGGVLAVVLIIVAARLYLLR